MSRQLGLDIRYYTCRKCGVEYGWLNGSLYDGECYAPKEVRIVASPQSLEREVKDLNEAIEFIRLRGGVIDFPNGIMEPDKIKALQEKEELVIKKVQPEFTIRKADTNEEIKCFTLDEMSNQVKETPKDESNS
jgi:hypothetical protein